MSASTLLDAVTAACDEMGYQAPSSLVGNQDDDARQFLALANKAGRELVRAHTWAPLQALAQIVTVAGQADYALPADFHRLLDETEWDRSTRWPLVGPITPQAYRSLVESATVPAALRRDFRLIGSTVRLFPVPAIGGDALVLEYLSRNWVRVASTGTAAPAFTTDQDTTVFDFDLLVKEIAWRWRSAKGFDATVAKYERDEALADLKGADLGGPDLHMGDTCEAGETVVFADPSFRTPTA